MTVKSSVSLTDEQHAFARDLVMAGRYSSVSAVLQRGIDMLRNRLESEETETEALKILLSERREGDFITGAQMDGRISEIVERKRRTQAVLD
ncbi:MAG: type II toxin-antitoxin system ParD family antitoxin [Gammaproteobacteria bacterium]|nr:type II toxin-antitoxin system ParD family antitoxin [Gammaproteobacteria bacterium]